MEKTTNRAANIYQIKVTISVNLLDAFRCVIIDTYKHVTEILFKQLLYGYEYSTSGYIP
jgi:hypothetical protein